MRRLLILAGCLAASLPRPVQGQESGFTAACAEVSEGLRVTCRVVAQASEAAQPQIGLLIAGGNPTIGTASTGGLRLGVLPRVSGTVKANLVFARLPDLRDVRTTPTDGVEYTDMGMAVPALSGTATIGLFSGASVAPTIGGIGSLDVLGTASWLPLSVLRRSEFRTGSADFSWGAGARLGILRESFTMPGVSLSMMYHKLGTVQFGGICSAGVATSTREGPGYALEEGQCGPVNPFEPEFWAMDVGELHFDLSSWSTRAAVSKHLLGLGISAGVGYDRFSSDLAAGVQLPRGSETVSNINYTRLTDMTLSQSRWSAFADGSFSILVATFAGEVGWMQGGDPVSGYPLESSDFDPAEGTFFGSLGMRLAL